MDAKVQIKELFTSLNFSDKLSVLEDLATLLEKEDGAALFLSDFSNEDAQTPRQIDNPPVGSIENKTLPFQNNQLKTIDLTVEDVHDGETTLKATSQKRVLKKCIECNSSTLIRWGTYKNEQRYKCKSCGHTFTANTLNITHGIHKTEDFLDFGSTMFNGEFHSLTFMSEKYEINKKTAFDWRHKYLSSISTTKEPITFRGNVEMDDVWVEFNEKGRHEKTDSRKRGGGTRGDNDNKVKVLFSVERGGESSLKVVRSGRLYEDDIVRALSDDSFDPGAVLISDKHPSIGAFAKTKGIEHKTFEAKKHVENKEIHVQTINNMASSFKAVINNKMRGVATKYLQNYANWFRVEQRYKGVANKIINIIEKYMRNAKAWDYFSNIERIYKRFIEKYTRLDYLYPGKRKWKACNWNYSNVEELLI